MTNKTHTFSSAQMHTHLPEEQMEILGMSSGLQPTGWRVWWLVRNVFGQTRDSSPSFSGQLAGRLVGRRLHYQEPWYGPGFDDKDDGRLNHVKSQVSVDNSFPFYPSRWPSGRYFQAAVKDSDSVRWLCVRHLLGSSDPHTHTINSVQALPPRCVSRSTLMQHTLFQLHTL